MAGLISAPVIAAFAAIVAIGAVVVANWEKIKAGAIALKDRVVTAFLEWREKNAETIEAVRSSLVALWAKVKEVFGAVMDAVREVAVVVFNELNKILEPMGGAADVLSGGAS